MSGPLALAWTAQLLRRRPLSLLGPAVALAVTMALTAALGSFVSTTRAQLALRASAATPVDWQVQLTATADPVAVGQAVNALPSLRTVAPVAYVQLPAASARTPLGQRATGRTTALVVPADYASRFPGEIRPLLGASSTAAGALLAQQTAANLGAGLGDTVLLQRPTGPLAVRVAGVVDLPAADSLFQTVGAARGAGPAAPPDNVVLLPPSLLSAVSAGSPTVRQLHVGFDHHALPADPAAAADLVTARDAHLQAALAGSVLVADDLAAALSAAREDALYALLLVLLLGVPAVVLSASVVAALLSAQVPEQRRGAALLQLRGARSVDVAWVQVAETAALWLLAVLVAGPLSLLAAQLSGGGLHLVPCAISAAAGLLVVVAARLVPALRVATAGSSALRVQVAGVPGQRSPWPLRYGLDGLLLAAAAAVTALSASGGYQLVLVPEGVPQASVDWAALLAPALAWPGLALLAWRVTSLLAGRSWFPRAGDRGAPELVSAVVRRRRQVLARGATGLAVALAVVATTAVFTGTYDKQARLDVALTVGADAAVSVTPGRALTGDALAAGRTAPAVGRTSTLQHRLAYVGPDLQDLFGVDPVGLRQVAPLQDSFTPGSTVRAALAALQHRPDGVLLSAETLRDYQLHTGDLVRLRLQAGPSHAYRPVDFHVVGQVKEFPTAPKDSFIIANSAYIAATTGDSSVQTLLLASSDPAATGAALHRRLDAQSVKVQDVVHDRAAVTTAGGLAATDLAGLSRLVLAFGLPLAAGAGALALLAGGRSRRRGLLLLTVLGGAAADRRRFVSAEARVVVVGGLVAAVGITAALSWLLVHLLTGAFDPPPAAATVPAGYLAALAATGALSVVVAAVALARYRAQDLLRVLREAPGL